MHITVIGAANVDIMTRSGARIIHGDSNPADIKLAPGGVGRNIAENLSRLGAEVDLVTAVGADPFGAYLREHCVSCGIDTRAWIVREDMNTGVYLAALDCDGELYAGFNAMAVLESVKPGDLTPCTEVIRNADLLIADANLTRETLSSILDLRADCALMIDVASVAKAPRVKDLLARIDILKCNRAEAECLTGLTLRTEKELKHACSELISLGVSRVFVTLGAEGACAASEDDEFLLVPAIPVRVKNVTGAGDAFAAGVAMRFCDDLKTQAEYGIKLAARYLKGNK